MKTITYDDTKWKLVPIEPTRDMKESGYMQLPIIGAESVGADRITDMYKAMLSAAPRPEEGVEG